MFKLVALQTFKKFYFIKNILNFFIYVSFLSVHFVSQATVKASECREVLDQLNGELASYEETRRVFQKYGIKSLSGYHKRKTEIEELEGIKLPNYPHIYYEEEWNGWDDFLGLPPFPSYEGFQRIRREYNVRSQFSYNRRRKEIEELERIRLPIHPHFHYGQFGKKNKSSPFKILVLPVVLYEEAQIVLRNYNIQFESEYHRRRKEIEELERIRLPVRPRTHYKKLGKWKGLDNFLGKHNNE